MLTLLGSIIFWGFAIFFALGVLSMLPRFITFVIFAVLAIIAFNSGLIGIAILLLIIYIAIDRKHLRRKLS